jgi:hypothetical protein
VLRRLLFCLAIVLLPILTARTAASNPIHAKLVALPEKERNAMLTYAVQDERCRVTRSFFQGLDKSGDAHWNVACDDGRTFAIRIKNDAQGSTTVLECRVIKAMGGTDCFKKF